MAVLGSCFAEIGIISAKLPPDDEFRAFCTIPRLRIGYAYTVEIASNWMKPDGDEGKNPNLATTLASVAMDAAKLITGVPLDYPDPLLTPLATVPQPAKEESVMDDVKDEKDKPLVDQMTDVVADAAGELAKTAVKAVAKRAKKAVASHTPRPIKRAAKAVAKAAKAPKKTAKKAKKAVAKKAKKAAPKKSKKKSRSKKSKR